MRAETKFSFYEDTFLMEEAQKCGILIFQAQNKGGWQLQPPTSSLCFKTWKNKSWLETINISFN